MTRRDIVKKIMDHIGPTDVVITSTGLISREVFAVKDRELNFYMMGSMGNALAIGMGIALHCQNKVIVIQGDGAALMGLGQIITANKLKLWNLYHIILDNGRHESTGGQPTASMYCNFSELSEGTIQVHAIMTSDDVPPRITLTPAQITERFKNALANNLIR